MGTIVIGLSTGNVLAHAVLAGFSYLQLARIEDIRLRNTVTGE